MIVDGSRDHVWEPSHDEMERLFVNNESLDRIRAYLNRFNPIRTMKMERMEIRHSAILAWLFDPTETHGLGDEFLKAFLAEALRGSHALRPTALDVAQSDLRDAEVRCEWQSIDIFVLSEANGWAFIIENKFDAKQGKNQLAGYAKKVQQIFAGMERPPKTRGIFLTLNDEEPADGSYATIAYEKVCELLSRLIKRSADQLSAEVNTFLAHYLEILKDATGMSEERTEMQRLARELYQNHRKVLDFVFEHGAGSEFAVAARGLFGDNPNRFDQVEIGGEYYVFNGLGNQVVSFLPLSWYDAFGGVAYLWPGCEGWWAGLPLISWLQLHEGDGSKGTIRLVAEVGPLSGHEFRKALIEEIVRIAAGEKLPRISFQRGASEEGRKYSKFLKDKGVVVDDIHDPDELVNGMKKCLSAFKTEFDALAKVLPNFKERGTAKGQ